ncbi:uncharacterized protein N7458_002567 [Penicillium daleae]|uniref:NACHT domain-containing protein n=1 Tax=Penicillium daleae TaxID=63821 RepID=A0AAD6CG16_9EURO|nr:uncharacterized protein N7458_002567 [Penicillium daleae]KAJ5461015.1 hypothetical protein N7458_002567 [Penicillium daleae]
MASTISFGDSNSGLQAGIINGSVTFLHSETSLNQACLRDLRTTRPQDDKDRIEKTNGGLLKDSYRWILDNEKFKEWQDNESSRLLWIRGDPGKGKTMLLCGIIDELTRSMGDNANIAFFFCQATDVRINSAAAVLRGLIYSLVEKQPSLLSHVRSRYDQAGKTLFEDINAWNALSKIFKNILKDPTLQNTYLVIDALDECTTDLPFLLDFVVQESSIYSDVKWIVSSRNWPDIEERLDNRSQTVPISLELNGASVSDAVKKFIRYKVYELAKVKNYGVEIRDTIYCHLSSNSQDTFLWVALVCQDLNRTSRRHVLKKLTEFPPGLDAFYGRMMDHVRKSEDAKLCKRVLAAISIVFRPIALNELFALFDTIDVLSGGYGALVEIIAICGSFLTLRENVIVFVHQSAKEYLLEKAHSDIFPRGQEAEHFTIFSSSLRTMIKTLRRNMTNIEDCEIITEEIMKPLPDSLAAARYACIYWVDHLQRGWCDISVEHRRDERKLFQCFLQQRYLHWIEALSIFRSLSKGIMTMLKLQKLLSQQGESDGLLKRVHDGYRFIRYFRRPIESMPLQVYSSALIFSPTQSITRICYQKEKPSWVLNSPVVVEEWTLCLQTLEGHYEPVTSIAWSSDGGRLASSSKDGTVRVWDPITGQSISTLQGHSEWVNSIAWSPDGSRLASASYDKTIMIWDPVAGRCTSTLKEHSMAIKTIIWSPDGSLLASASYDHTVRVWKAHTSQCESTLMGHTDWVTSVAWSPDGSRLASASRDGTAVIWDPTTGQHSITLEGYDGAIELLAWSLDGSRLASAFYSAVCIWNPVSGQLVSILKGHRDSVTSIAWSPDGDGQLASASLDETVRIWNPATSQCLSTLDEHDEPVRSIAWSPDGSRLASASDDETVRIWDSAAGQYDSILHGHRAPVTSIAWSPDGSQLASASFDETVKVWDPAAYQCAPAPKGHSRPITTISWSPDGDRLVSRALDRTFKVWDPVDGQCVSTLEEFCGPATPITWSPDGARLASPSNNAIKVWNPATGQCAASLEGHTGYVTSIAWSPEGSRLASGSIDTTIRLWDTTTGQHTITLDGYSGKVEGYNGTVDLIVWSLDGSRLASAFYDSTVSIWNTASGQLVSILKGHRDSVTSIAWSPDGGQLASASLDETVLIWNPATGQCVSTLDEHDDSVSLIAWSPDGSRLASASDDETVRIWDAATGRCDSVLLVYSSRLLQFDKIIPSHLHTDYGTIDIEGTDATTSGSHFSTVPGTYKYDFSEDFSWVTCNGSKLLWLPTEYRPPSDSLFAQFMTTLAIGCSSGRVIFLALSEHNPLSKV